MTITAGAQKTKVELESEAYRFQQITKAEGDAQQVCNIQITVFEYFLKS
jgi:hypothetical protein